ncbi:MAG: putative flavoprotein involved in transport [Subtercola sp.]|nr:putative flavoprotein involved in transport [Subtercola sp.]
MRPKNKRTPSVVVIGSGFSGIAAAVRLKKAGYDITVLESAGGIGGTWWHNVYPSAEVDTPSVLYSYSYMPWNWSRTHVRQDELRQYIAAVADRFGVTPHIRFGVRVERVVWDENRQNHRIIVDGQDLLRADYVVSAVGLLSDPLLPDWPGLDEFRGPIFHTAKWENHDLAGKRIAVTGSGSTATQVVPALAEIAAEVVMYQREPGWVVPKVDREFTEEERAALDHPNAQRLVRLLMLLQRDKSLRGGKVWRAGTPEQVGAEAVARAHIATSLAGRPDLIEAVTPTFRYGGKRIIISDTYYPALLRDNVTLVPRAVARLTPTGVVDIDGVERPVDAVVLSTGFNVKFLSTLDVVGRCGIELHDAWGGDPTALLGIMVPGFPNFFMMYGPNTNGGAIVSNAEIQADYLVAAIKHAERRGASSIEVRRAPAALFDSFVQQRMRGTAFEYQNNYYKGSSGRITTQWPDGLLLYGLLAKLLRAPVWKLEFRAGRSQLPGVPDDAVQPSMKGV